jgi:outer membrane receptor for ferric coprogen and ferric-rhodotorulic acid
MKKNKKKVISLSFFASIALATPLLANEIISLDSVEVTAPKTSYVATEEVDSYTIGSMNTSTKLDLSIKDTPQTISVITSQEMKDKQINSFHDVLANIPGLTINNRGDNFVSSVRGFDLTYFKIDGVPTYSTVNHNNFDLAIYDRVEIVKGANGLTTGEGDPSFSMNFIRKHANSKEVEGSLSLSAGSWDSYSQTLDVSAPITDDKNVRGRFIAKHEDSDAFYDNYNKKNDLFYGIIDADLGDLTTLSIGATYQNLRNNGIWSWGLPAFYSDNTRTDFSRSTSLTPEWTYINLETKEVFASVKQYLYDDISLNLSSSFIRTNQDSNTVQIRGSSINKTTGTGLSYNNYSTQMTYDEINFDSYLKFPFTINHLSQEIIAGFSYNDRTKELKDRQVLPWPAVNFYTFVIPNVLESSAFTQQPDVDTTQLGSYLAGRFSLSENLKLISGLRVSNWKYHNDNPAVADRTFKDVVTPYAGLVYDLDDYHAVYVSYTDIFKPQSAKDIHGDYLDPIVGKNYETGIKGEYFEGKLNTSFSLFKIVQDNVAKLVNGVTLPSGEYVYEAAKGVTSKGFEASVSGELGEAWSLAFGFAHFSAEDAKGDVFNTKASRTTATAFTKYKISNDLTLGGGLNYCSKIYTGSGTSYIEQEAYTLANVMAKYQINKRTELQLNINNLFDKKYYEGIGTNLMVYGAPRNAMLSMRYYF